MAAVDPKVVAQGAAVQIAIAVPAAVVVSILREDDVGAESNLWLVAFFLALVVGPAVAGWFVARRRPDSPVLHAVVACGAAWTLLTAVRLLRAALASDDVAPLLATLITIAPIQVGIGVLGSLFSRSRPRPEGNDPVSATAETQMPDTPREQP